MAVYFMHNDIKEKGPEEAKQNANLLVAVKAPVKSDSYAAFMAKVIAQEALAAGDWFYNYENSGNDLRVTTNAKTAVDPSGVAADTEDLCMAAVDTVNEKVFICQDATDRIITNEEGDRVTLPGLNFLIPELVAE
ncbi:hypothetical protein [Paraglaciecola sp.]|uniref:hypothetical protein n=1 Tax=Paraglaciecola sp. TaxID=1920173 RepID=UPI003EF9ECDB